MGSFHRIISGSFPKCNVRFANSDKDLSQEEFYERWPALQKRFKLFGMGHGPMEDYTVYRRERLQELMPAERGSKKVRHRNKIDASGICPEDMENLESWDSAGFDENAFIRIEGRSILLDRSVDVNGGILVANGGRLVFKDNGPAGEMIKLSQVFKKTFRLPKF